jgi:N-acetylmuramoyl-L-alanine amidase
MRRIILTTCLLLAAGCARPRRVIEELPPPVMDTYRRPAPTVRPTPLPAKPPEAPARRPARSIGAVTIVIDAGHGGKDPGAQGLSASPEKTINLDIATRLARLLEEAGAKVVTTRSSDRFIELDDRAALADRSRADLFVSIHADSAQRASASGTTIYVARNALSQSRHAARSIVAAFQRAGIECRGTDSAGFRVLVGHSRPAVLIECGFLTNRADASRLNTATYRAKLAAAISDGIVTHFGG